MGRTVTPSMLITPYGGTLVNLLVGAEEQPELVGRVRTLPAIQLSPRTLCDLELLATGAFSPLDRFMDRADHRRVLEEMRLADGTLFPIPITLPVSDRSAIQPGRDVALRSPQGELLAILTVEEIFEREPEMEALAVCGTTDDRHPLVAEMASWGRWCVSGPLTVLRGPTHHDFAELRQTPSEVRALLERRGASRVVAFQTRNPMHRAHEELTKRAAEEIRGTLLLHPVVGLTKPGDLDHYTRVRTFKAIVEKYYDPNRTVLSLLPLAMRMAGPREAVWHAIIRRNYGATHFIVGRDHASPGCDFKGAPFYGPYDAQALLGRFGAEIGVTMVPYKELVYLPDELRYEEADRVPQGKKALVLSGTMVREDYLAAGKPLPAWFTRPEVAAILSDRVPPRHQEGFCVWFTGLPGSGKSTIAEILAVLLMERGRQITLLDGDVVRTHLSKGLGFTKQDRDANVLRIGFVASEVVRHRGAVICAAVSPYRAARNQVRAMVGAERFVLVYVETPRAVCEQRDAKGLYARAQRGALTQLTGVDDPYEVPVAPELTVSTAEHSPGKCASQIVRYLNEKGFLREG